MSTTIITHATIQDFQEIVKELGWQADLAGTKEQPQLITLAAPALARAVGAETDTPDAPVGQQRGHRVACHVAAQTAGSSDV